MAQFTLLETVVFHRMLWAELAERGCYKPSALFWKEQHINPNKLIQECFPCNLAGFRFDGSSHPECNLCVFAFQPICYSPYSYYRRWGGVSGINTRKKYAALIRDIPLKPEYAKMLGE